jgi:DNA helicase-2/ATP-dependent DNA helicase PcrA
MSNNLDGMTEAQRAAILHRDGHAMVVACPGSGKTRVITHRLVQLIDAGANPAQLVSVTFTNKAAKEMRARVNKLLDPDVAKRLLISTFHSMCARILRIDAAAAGLSQNYNICDEDDATTLVTDAICFLTKKAPKEVKRDPGLKGTKYCRRFISGLKQTLTTPEDLFRQANERGREEENETFIRQVYERYTLLLKRSNCVDFDDLIMKVVLMFREHPDVQARYAKRVRYLQVDEYQDTNLSQYELAVRLSSEWNNLFIVGDAKQSIYKFRGADYTNITKFKEQFKDDLSVYFLKENFRSTKRIAASANQLIKQNKGHDTTEIVAVHHEGAPVRAVEAEDSSQEAAFAVDEIRKLVAAGEARYQDFAIIYRVHARSRRYEELLVANGVPHQVIGGTGFYARAAVKDVLAYLKLILNPLDDASFMRIYDSPPRGFGDVSYSRLAEVKELHQESLVEALLRDRYQETGDKRGQAGANKLKQVFQKFSELDISLVGPLVEQVLKITGYQEYIEKENAGEDKLQAVRLLEELVTATHGFDQRNNNAGLARFLEWIALMQEDENKDANPDKVSLMTCHAAKGLEFKHVYLVGVIEGTFPILRDAHDDGSPKSDAQLTSDLEEERRVCYVGMTRAEEGLTITHSRSTVVRNTTVSCTPSRFIEEMEGTLEPVQLEGQELGETMGRESKYGNQMGRYFQGQRHGREAFRASQQRKSYRSRY